MRKDKVDNGCKKVLSVSLGILPRVLIMVTKSEIGFFIASRQTCAASRLDLSQVVINNGGIKETTLPYPAHVLRNG